MGTPSAFKATPTEALTSKIESGLEQGETQPESRTAASEATGMVSRSASELKDATASDEEDDVVEDIGKSRGAGALENAEADQAESLRRKRDREGSLEPSLTPSKQESLPTKKNRLQSDLVAEVSTSISSSSPPRTTANAEGEKVGQIRKRVQDLSWKQRKEGNRDDGIDDDDAGSDKRTEKTDDASKSDEVAEAAEASAAASKADKLSSEKRSQPTFSSFSSSSGFSGAADKQKSGSIFDREQAEVKEHSLTQEELPRASKSPPPLPPRTQPTFSSFSKSSSPFGSASASIAGPSWLAGKASGASSAAGGGIKPSSLGSMPGSSKEEAASTPSPTLSAATSPPPQVSGGTGKGLGFGAFATSTPFSAKPAIRSSTPSSSTDEGQKKAAEEKSNEPKNGKSFDEALREGDGLDGRHETVSKIETQLDKGSVDLRTGEEDETTVASIRAKLFTMSEDKSWKERGTGTVRCNVPKHERRSSEGGNGARLVMRSEGVLRLILNVTLFKGMKVNLEQDKFLRLVAFEDGKLNHFALRMGNASAASQFYLAIQRHIPISDGDPTSGRTVEGIEAA